MKILAQKATIARWTVGGGGGFISKMIATPLVSRYETPERTYKIKLGSIIIILCWLVRFLVCANVERQVILIQRQIQPNEWL